MSYKEEPAKAFSKLSNDNMRRTSHYCPKNTFSPHMNAEVLIELAWYGWVLKIGNKEVRINYCPLCGENIEKLRIQ